MKPSPTRLEELIRWLKSLLPKPKPAPKPKPKPAPRPKPKPQPKPSRITMYDATEADQIPPSPEAVAGYVDGKYQSFNQMLKRFPRAKHVSIAVFAQDNARCLDVEKGDATPAEVPRWVRRQHARGIKRPWLYADKSTMPAIKRHLMEDHISRSQVILWVADPTGGKRHIPPGFDACQYLWNPGGRNVDISLCEPYCFD